MSDVILFVVEEGMVRFMLNWFICFNVFNVDLVYVWWDVMVEVMLWEDVKVIFIDVLGLVFCVGGDVIDMVMIMGVFGVEIIVLVEVINVGICFLIEFVIFVVVVVYGIIVGGGLGIFLFSDYVVVGFCFQFGSLYVNIGLMLDLLVLVQFVCVVGQCRVFQFVFQDCLLLVMEVVEWGFVVEVVEGESFVDEVVFVCVCVEEVVCFWLVGVVGVYGQVKWLVCLQFECMFVEQLSEEVCLIGVVFEIEDVQVRVVVFVVVLVKKVG